MHNHNNKQLLPDLQKKKKKAFHIFLYIQR